MKARLTALAGFTALAMSVGGVASVAAQAETAEFTASEAPVSIVGKATTVQSFQSTESSLAVECHTAATSGTAESKKSPTQLVHVKYSKCTAFGFEGPTISEAEYTFTAGVKGAGESSTGTAAVDNTITVSVPLAGCTVTITPTGNSALSSVDFSASGGIVSEVTNIKGITDSVSGGGSTCGGEGTHTNGTYKGNNEVSSTEAALGIS